MGENLSWTNALTDANALVNPMLKALGVGTGATIDFGRIPIVRYDTLSPLPAVN